jgi:hypothetical protein
MSGEKANDCNTGRLEEIVEQRCHIEGQSDLNVRLNQILEHYNSQLKTQIELRRQGSSYDSIKEPEPLSVYIFTDAVWTDNSNPKSAIMNIVNSLADLEAPRRQVVIQFISFGGDPDCLARLEPFAKRLGFKR